MKKILSILLLSLFSTVALAASNHGDGHSDADHNMSHVPLELGQPGDPAQVDRTVDIDMQDTMRFTPAEIQVVAGETIRFTITNSGKLPHEMVIGSLEDLKAHAIEMRADPGMMHDEPNAVTLAPGEQGILVWHFDHSGTVDFACTIPGHMEAGMIGKVTVK